MVRPRAKRALGRTALMLLAACLLGAGVQLAHAVSTTGRFTVTVTPPTIGQYASYAFSSFKVANKETVTGYTLTFPAGIDATGATSSGPGDVVTVAPDGRTVTVVLGTPVRGPGSLVVALGNILNPTTPGDYAVSAVTFSRQGAPDQVVSIASETFTIAPPPYLSMTITTPDASQTVDFGAIPPEVTTAGKSVTILVDSGVPYDLTRSVAGQTAEMGLAVTGTGSGTNLPAGPSSYLDAYTATPPWTSDPNVLFTATVTYTVVQH